MCTFNLLSTEYPDNTKKSKKSRQRKFLAWQVSDYGAVINFKKDREDNKVVVKIVVCGHKLYVML